MDKVTGKGTEARCLAALRGAATARNEAPDIQKQASLLYDELLSENGLEEADIVSLFFSLTEDLNALNPASALRETGRAAGLAMMVFQEASWDGAMRGVIRVLLHCYLKEGREVRHVYRNGAESLRPDRIPR